MTRTFRSTSAAVIDMESIVENVENITNYSRKFNPNVKIMPVIKANAYGHGDVKILSDLHDQLSIKRFAVNRIREGIKIRKTLGNKIKTDILILGYGVPEEVTKCVTFDLTPTISGSHAIVESLYRECEKQDKTIKVHIKIDTGMGRFGILPEKIEEFLDWFYHHPQNLHSRIKIEGIFTHFSCADEPTKDYTQYQFEKFKHMKDLIDSHAIASTFGDEILYHCCNSAATLFYPEMHLDMVRPGISIYGLSPSNITDDHRLPFKLKPALSIMSHVARVETLKHQSAISYGNTYKVQNEHETFALIPVGYGDGYKRINSNRAHVLIRGEECPIVGRVCMDQFVAKVPESIANQVKVNDEVILLGRQHDREITCEKVSEWSHTINYEVVTGLQPRLKREYLHATRRSPLR